MDKKLCNRNIKNTQSSNPVVYELRTATTGATFQINSAKLYVPFVTQKIESKDLKELFLGTNIDLKQQHKKNNNLDYLIDPTFRSINRLFVLSFKNCYDDPTRYSFDKYYMAIVEIRF